MALGLGLLAFFLLLWWGARRQEERFRLVALAGLVGAGALVGGLLASVAVGELGLSSLGGIAGAGLVLLFAPPWLGEDRGRAWDVVIPAGIAGLAVARLGCLWEGCDFGRRTAEWGVAHPPGTRAWTVHVMAYDLPLAAPMSHPVQPFPVYLAAWGFVAALLGIVLARRSLAPGRAGTAAAALFLAGGGVIEWLREPLTVIRIGESSAYPLIYAWGAVVAFLIWRRMEPTAPEES